MKKFKRILVGITALMMIASLVACTSTKDTQSPSPAGDSAAVTADAVEVRTITVAFVQGNAPTEYINDDGEPDGYDIKALQAIDELLPEYEFEYVGTTLDDLATGVTEGKYQIGVSSSFKTPAREEKMLFPEENIGAAIIGMIVRNEDSDCDTIRKAVEKGLEMCPISSSDGMWVVVDTYNNENPDAQVVMASTDVATLADFYIYVAEGRYDYLLMAASLWDALIVPEDSDLHYLVDELVQYEISAVKTWTLLNQEETDLAAALDEAIAQLKEDGTLSTLQVEYYGMDQFEYLEY